MTDTATAVGRKRDNIMSFKRAYDLAIALEAAKKNTAELKQKEAMSMPDNPERGSVHQL